MRTYNQELTINAIEHLQSKETKVIDIAPPPTINGWPQANHDTLMMSIMIIEGRKHNLHGHCDVKRRIRIEGLSTIAIVGLRRKIARWRSVN